MQVPVVTVARAPAQLVVTAKRTNKFDFDLRENFNETELRSPLSRLTISRKVIPLLDFGCIARMITCIENLENLKLLENLISIREIPAGVVNNKL